MLRENTFIILIYIAQLFFYSIRLLKSNIYNFKKRYIFLFSIILCFVAPLIYPYNKSNYNEDADKYIDEIQKLFPYGRYWIIGNLVNSIILVLFILVDKILKCIKTPNS